MSVLITDPMTGIAEAVADCLSQQGYAFVEDDKLEALADTLRSFLKTARIPVNEVADGNRAVNSIGEAGP